MSHLKREWFSYLLSRETKISLNKIQLFGILIVNLNRYFLLAAVSEHPLTRGNWRVLRPDSGFLLVSLQLLWELRLLCAMHFIRSRNSAVTTGRHGMPTVEPLSVSTFTELIIWLAKDVFNMPWNRPFWVPVLVPPTQHLAGLPTKTFILD
jgi:hypothetical protein